MGGFVALLFSASQLQLERFDGGARFGLEPGLPLHLGGQVAGLRLRAQLGDQVLLTLLCQGLGSLVFLLHFLAQLGFQLT